MSMLTFMGTRDDNLSDKRARIVAAARELFAKHGYEPTTTRQIAAKARIAHGTLFRYAQTKPEVVLLVFEDTMLAAFEDAVTSVPRGSFSTRAMHVFSTMFDMYGRDLDLARVLVKELVWVKGDGAARLRTLNTRLFVVLLELAEQARVGKHVAAKAVPVLAASAAGLYLAALTAWLTGELDVDGARTMLREGLRLLEKGARP